MPIGGPSPLVTGVAARQALSGIIRAPARLISDNGLGIVSPDGARILTNNSAGIVTNNGAGILANNSAGVIANNSAGVVANNGAGVVANKGGTVVSRMRYALASVSELPLEGAVVRLRRPTGTLVNRADGQPLYAITGPDGGFAFPEAPPGALFVEVDYGVDFGRLAAITPRPIDPTGRPPVELGLVSSLATSYVATAYLPKTTDPQAALDRLTPAMEAETRLKAASALDATGTTAPVTLVTSRVTELVDALRQRDPALDAQLEAVRKVLIAAGQSDFGAGQLALDVALTAPGQLLPMADGSLLFGDRRASARVWRLRTDGRLDVVAGLGTDVTNAGDGSSPDGKTAKDALLPLLNSLSRDQAGRLLLIINQGTRVLRLEADGRLTQLANTPDLFAGFTSVLPGPGDTLWTLRRGSIARLQSLTAGGALTDSHAFTATQSAPMLFNLQASGVDPDGRLYFKADSQEIARFDPVSKAWDIVATAPTGGSLALDPAGNVFSLGTDRVLRLQTPAGAASVVLAETPAGWTLRPTSAALAADGSVLLAPGDHTIQRVRDGAASRVAGAVGAPGQPGSGPIALNAPVSAVPGPGGTLFVVEAGLHRIVQVDAQGGLAAIAGTGLAGRGEDGPATASALDTPWRVRRSDAGDLFVAEGRSKAPRLRRIGTTGRIETIFEAAHPPADPADAVANTNAGVQPFDFAVTPAGAVLVQSVGKLYYAPPGGTFARVAAKSGLTTELVACSPDGRLWSWNRTIDTRTFDFNYHLGELQPSGEHPVQAFTGAGGSVHAFAVDARGRAHLLQKDGSTFKSFVLRVDATGAVKLTGPGAPLLGGSGADDGLVDPRDIVFAANGDLYLTDEKAGQVKIIPATGM